MIWFLDIYYIAFVSYHLAIVDIISSNIGPIQ